MDKALEKSQRSPMARRLSKRGMEGKFLSLRVFVCEGCPHQVAPVTHTAENAFSGPGGWVSGLKVLAGWPITGQHQDLETCPHGRRGQEVQRTISQGFLPKRRPRFRAARSQETQETEEQVRPQHRATPGTNDPVSPAAPSPGQTTREGGATGTGEGRWKGPHHLTQCWGPHPHKLNVKKTQTNKNNFV